MRLLRKKKGILSEFVDPPNKLIDMMLECFSLEGYSKSEVRNGEIEKLLHCEL